MEIWRDVKGYEGLYQVSNLGKVKNLSTNKLAQPSLNDKGYLKVSMSKNNKWKTEKVHRLVAETFLRNNDPKAEINHKNGNKLDNRVDNLEWVSHRDNMKHAWQTGLIKPTGRPKKQLVCLYGHRILFRHSQFSLYY